MVIHEARGQGWRGIVPLHSTRADVERILGKSDNDDYKLKDRSVSFSYSDGRCTNRNREWNVPKDTVIQIHEYFFDPKPSLIQFEKQLKEYSQIREGDYLSLVFYRDMENGVSIEVNTDLHVVNGIEYVPSSRDHHLRCPGFARGREQVGGSRKFDAFEVGNKLDEQKRLRDFAVQLKNEPSSLGHIIVYGSPLSIVKDIESTAESAKSCLVDLGINGERIIVTNGGCRDVAVIELWIQPNGYSPPSNAISPLPCDFKK